MEPVSNPATIPTQEVTMSAPLTISYAEACEHAEMNYRNTNGLVCGGSYMIHSDEVGVYEVDLRVDPDLGIARPVR